MNRRQVLKALPAAAALTGFSSISDSSAEAAQSAKIDPSILRLLAFSDAEESAGGVHYFHADAAAFGGRLAGQVLPTLASTSLPESGGFASSDSGKFRLGQALSIDAAYSHVAGGFDVAKGCWTTIVKSVLQGLNVGGVLSADRITLQITTDHPLDGYYPKISFAGTRFEGLSIGGAALTPALNLSLCEDSASGEYPSRSCLYNEKFLGIAERQRQTFVDFWSSQPAVGKTLLAGSVSSKTSFAELVAKRGNVLCSVVEGIEGQCQGTAFGHAIDVPSFGRVFLGELKVDQGSFTLNMLRVESRTSASPSDTSASGSDTPTSSGGTISASHGSANGTNSGGT
jgi:hypothetical protein